MRYLILITTYLAVAVMGVYLGTRLAGSDSATNNGTIAGSAPTISALDPDDETGRDFFNSESVASSRSAATTDLQAVLGQATIFRQQLAAHQLAAASNQDALKPYLLTLAGSDDPFLRMSLAFIFLERFIELDVTAAIGFVENSNLPMEVRHQYLASIVTTWVRHDPEPALDYFTGISNLQLKQQIGMRLMQDSSLKATGLHDEVVRELGPMGERMVQSLRQRQTDPQELLQEAMALTGQQRTQRMYLAFSRWMQNDPNAALSAILALENRQEQASMLMIAISIRAQNDPLAALELARTYAADHPQAEITALSAMAQHNREQALPFIEEYVSRTGNSSILVQIVGQWGQSDLPAALDYTRNLSDEVKQQVYPMIAHHYAQQDPEAAMQWAIDLGNQQVISNTFNSVAQSFLSRAERWFDRLEDHPQRDVLLNGIATQKAAINPREAITWLESQRSGSDISNAVNRVLQSWGERDPAAASDYLSAYGNDEQYTSVFSSLAHTWLRRDRDAAIEWVSSIPSGSGQQAATQTLLSNLWRTDRDRVVSLLSSLPDGATQQVRLQLAYQWLGESPQAHDEIIRTLDLNAEQAERIRGRAGRSR